MTVYEAANLEVKKLSAKIEELLCKRRDAYHRMRKYHNSKMLESERLASKAEPYQTIQLPIIKEV